MRQWLITLLVPLLLISCRGAVEEARQNVHIGAAQEIERQGLRGARVVFPVENGLNRKIVIKQADLTIYDAGARMVGISSREKIIIARAASGEVETLWRIDPADPLSGEALMRKLRQKELDSLTVSYIIKGHAGLAPIKIRAEAMPFCEFLNTFGLTLDDVQQWTIENGQ